MNEQSNKEAWERFCRLGEMIGDGLHHEEPWILKDYKHLEKQLIPEASEIYRKQRQSKNIAIDLAVKIRLETIKCPECKGQLNQKRSGSYKVSCVNCGTNFKFKTK